jgi:serine protease AprX
VRTTTTIRTRHVGSALGAVLLLVALVQPATVNQPHANRISSTAPVPAPGPVGHDPWSALWLGSSGTGPATTLAEVRSIVGADTGTTAHLDGSGVGIALIDTGVVPVPGLPASRIVNGPDLSFESQSANLRWLDTYGHGTHLAGIIVGDDPATNTRGLAPGARLTSIKVGAANGAVDVSQVIAAIDWVVAHRNDDPAYPIRVLNLAYGSGGDPAFWTDPLQFAVEQAWHAGIVVVSAVGNDGNGHGRLNNPASNPYAIGVGAAVTRGTVDTSDDQLAPFTNLANAGKQVDFLAPGESIVSLRNPGSNVDNRFPAARVGTTLFRGTGTSQAAAVTTAVVALLLQARPWLVPDQVKWLLTESATFLPTGPGANLGLKQINLAAALNLPVGWVPQQWTRSDGTGRLEDARGGSHVVRNGVRLQGESSIFGPFVSSVWAARSAARTAWQGGLWMGHRLAGDDWTGSSWALRTWAPAAWTAPSWDGSPSWLDPAWSSHFWSTDRWSDGNWVSHFWSTDSWAGG